MTCRGSITVRLTSCLDGLESTKQVNLLLFNISKAAESKQVKQDISCTVIFTSLVSEYYLMSLLFLYRKWPSLYRGSFSSINFRRIFPPVSSEKRVRMEYVKSGKMIP